MLPRETVNYRIQRGWSPEKARTVKPFGECITSKCEAAGISRYTYYSRLKRGWTKEAALAPIGTPPSIAVVNAALRAWKRPV